MSHSPAEIARHIRDEADYLIENSRSVSREVFLADATLKRAFVRSLEVIGEAAKQIQSEVRSAHPEIEWRLISGMRDRLIHGYFGVDYEIVWDVVVNKIPELRENIEALLDG